MMKTRSVAAVAAMVLACALIAGCSKSGSAVPVQYHLSMTEFGCVQHATQDRIGQLDAEGDKTAALAFIRQNLATGECIEFNKGSIVYVDDAEAWSGLDKVHAQGSPNGYWIVASVVKPGAPPAITWLPAEGHLFDGVEVYKGTSHKDVGLIAGGTHGFMVPHSDGSPGITVHPILVVYKSDSSRHWMDTREFAGWFVKSDDPRINSGHLTMLDTDVTARAATLGAGSP